MLKGEPEGLFVAVYLWRIGQLELGKEEEGYIHTAKKYALSPAPCLPESGRYLAYGGPHALVSSPRVGCSIFITSALGVVSRGV